VTSVTNTAGRLRRLLAVLTWLAQVGEAPIDEVAARFGLKPATLVAELEMAACCGLPPYTPDQLMDILVTDTTVSAQLGDLLTRPRRLTAAEGFTLAASARALLAVPGSDADGVLAQAVAKLDRVLAARSLVVELDAPEMLEPVRRAVAEGHQLVIGYYSASRDQLTHRRIDPVDVVALEGHWYVDAYCHEASDERRFRVDRIQEVEVGPPSEHRTRTTGAHPAPFLASPESRTVRLSLEPSAAWIADTVAGAGPAEAVGDRIEVDLTVASDVWLVGLLLRLGPTVRLVDRHEAAETGPLVADVATRILQRYEASGDQKD